MKKDMTESTVKKGRKSAYQEKADAEALNSAFFTQHNWKKLAKKIESGKFSIADKMLYDAYKGEKKYTLAMFNKVYPDMMFQKNAGAVTINIIDFDKIADKIKGTNPKEYINASNHTTIELPAENVSAASPVKQAKVQDPSVAPKSRKIQDRIKRPNP